MSNDYTVGAYMAPPVVALYMVAPVDDCWKPGKYTITTMADLPEPEEMKRIALESVVVEDLLKRVMALEERVAELVESLLDDD